MAKNLLNIDFDEASMIRKLKKLGKKYGDTQDQAVKRWGVQTCRELAKYQQPFFAKNKKQYRDILFKDAYKVLLAHEGGARTTKKGNRKISHNGKIVYIQNERYLDSEMEIHRWIETNRTLKNKSTTDLPNHKRKWCSQAKLNKVIKLKMDSTAGLSKDGWLDAGDHIARGQKGPRQAKIGKGYLKWARKPLKVGTSKQGRRAMNSFGELVNKVTYAGKSDLLSMSNKRKAIRDGAQKTIKFYEFAIRAENKKRK